VRGLTKRYGSRAALQALDLTLAERSFVALLGPNGAGKTTLFQVLTGLFAADEGDVTVAGHSLRAAPGAALRHLGVVFQQMSLDLDLTVERNLRFHADLHGLPATLARERIAQAAAAFGLAADLARLARELRRDLLAAIRADVAERGTTVLWATHLVEEAEAADRVLVLHKGKLLADGTPAAVTATLGGATLEEAFIRATA